MKDDGNLEKLTMQVLRVTAPMTWDLDEDEAILVMMAAAAITVSSRTGCDFEASYARLRDLADTLSENDELH